MGREYNIRPLSSLSVKKIHDESLRILKEIGFKVPNKKVLEILKENKADVDFDNEIVRFPGDLIMECLKQQLDNNKTFFNRHPRYRKTDHTMKGWMSLGNTYEIFEPVSSIRRKSNLSDIIKAIILANGLENIDRVSAFVVPNEYKYNEELVDVIQYYLLYLYSKKRYFMGITRKYNSARCLIEMAKTIAEDDFQLRSGDLLEYELEATSNLEYCPDHVSIAYEFARNKLRVRTTHFALMGKITPLNYASTITLLNAHILAGTAIIILMNPENAFARYISAAHITKKGDSELPLYGSPSQSIFAFMAKQMADFYGFENCYTNSNISDAFLDDFQFGFEKGVSATIPRMLGFNQCGVEGIVGFDEGSSFERLVIGNEFLSYLNFIFGHDYTVDDNTIDFERIKKIGIGGNFASSSGDFEKHDYLYWNSDIFIREWHKDWRKNRNMTLDRIENKIQGILKENFPPKLVIDESKVEELDNIIGYHIKDISFPGNFKKELEYIIKAMV